MELNELLDFFIDEELVDIIISNPKKSETMADKIKIRPVKLGEELKYQSSSYVGKKVIHENYTQEGIKEAITLWMINDYKQGQFTRNTGAATVLSGKKGNITIKYKPQVKSSRVQAPLSHNRSKKYILNEGDNIPFLVDLNVMTKEGKIVNSRYDKFRQINRYLEFIEDILPQLDKNRRQNIIDFGCGKSYLTFAMYYYLKVVKDYDINVIGLDLKEDVIETCNALAAKYGYSDLKFLVGDIASYNEADSVDMVVTLHACDTATDFALYKAVKWGAKVILSVPCCQHEANGQIECEALEPILKYGILKERMSALITDGLRANILEECGYKTQILEFIDMEHTPKNLLIRAVFDKKAMDGNKGKKQQEKVAGMEKFLSLDLTLDRLVNRSGDNGEN